MQTGSLDLYRFLFYFHRPRSADKTGDTLLHLIGAAREAGEIFGCKYSKEFACTAIQLLVRYGHVDPQALNKKGHKAVDYYKPSDIEYGYLQYPETCLNYTDPCDRVSNCWFYYFAQRLGVHPKRTELLIADAANNISGDGGGAYLCQREELLRFFGALLHEDHKRQFSKSHADLIGRLLPDLLELLSQSDLISARFITDQLLSPAALLACLLHGLITLDTNTAEDGTFKCWKSIHVLLKCYFGSAASVNPDTNLKPTLEHGLRLYLGVHTVEAVVEDARRGNVAASARLQDLLMSGYQRGDQTKRLELVDLLRRAGALCDLSGMEMSELSSQQRQGFARDLPQLMQRGLLGPDCLGENPLYKALIVALDIEPGYFELFEHLLDLYKSDPESHPQLDPCLRDRDGNTLYHTAAATRSRHSIEAVRKIAELTDANPNLRNKARQTALQAICRSVRRRDRAQLVMQLTQAAARFPEPEPVDSRPDLGADDDASGDESDADSGSEASGSMASGSGKPSVGSDLPLTSKQQKQLQKQQQQQ
uniref:ANK_REP_REGION domain-containing protein n=1 Tax=Macrostomum lignano TaxID=282301 RepID=A0A1I8ILB4_9PLAT